MSIAPCSRKFCVRPEASTGRFQPVRPKTLISRIGLTLGATPNVTTRAGLPSDKPTRLAT